MEAAKISVEIKPWSLTDSREVYLEKIIVGHIYIQILPPMSLGKAEYCFEPTLAGKAAGLNPIGWRSGYFKLVAQVRSQA